MLESRKLREQYGNVATEIQKMADVLESEDRDFSAEEQEKWDKLNKDVNDLESRIARAEKIEGARGLDGRLPSVSDPDVGRGDRTPVGDDDDELRAAPNRDADSPEARMQRFRDEQTAIGAWARAQVGHELRDAEMEACRRVRINPRGKYLDLVMDDTRQIRLRRNKYRAAEFRADVTAGSGGETIPEGFVNNWEMALLEFGGVRQVATIIRTASGNDLPWPTTDDTGNTGRLLAEATAVTETDITTSSLVLNAYKYSSDLVKVSAELLEDSAFDIPSELGRMLGTRIGRITNTHFTTGDGSAKPNGIVTASALGKTTAAAGAITADEVIDLFHSVDPAYRNQPGAGWMFHDNVLAVIRKLKGSDNNYLWQPGLQAGEPPLLLGKPYTINQDMQSTVVTATKTMIFGNLRKYIIRDVAGFRLRRLVERYADADQEGFVAFSRHDGDELDAGTNPIKHMLQA